MVIWRISKVAIHHDLLNTLNSISLSAFEVPIIYHKNGWNGNTETGAL